MAAQPNQSPLIAVVGETASGKSGLALKIARRYNGEIICADSRTIYKAMDIGTAKPSMQERAEIQHHLLDVVAPGESFTAADFQRLAKEAIADITSRGRLPIVVGGTGLYVDSILFDYQFGGRADTQQRTALEALDIAELRTLIEQKGLVAPYNEKNKRHLVRTLERATETPADREHMRPHTLVLGLSISRSTLRSRIEERVEQMFRKGLRKEVQELQAQFGWESEALTGIGYREFKPFYTGDASMSEVKRRIVQDTLQLAKRQRTWFKRNPQIIWCSTAQEAEERVAAFLAP